VGDGPPPDRDLNERVADFIEGIERSRAMRREATSSAAGEFTIDGLLEEPYAVQAYLAGFTINAEQQEAQHRARPGDWIDFTASPVVVVPVDVRMPDGSTAARAQLRIRRQNSSTGQLWTADTPELRTAPGSYAIRATAGDRDELRSEEKNVVLAEGVTPAPLSFRLEARTSIRGRVKVPRGYATDSLTIFAVRWSGTAAPSESVLLGGQNMWASTWNGYRFEFHDLSAGKWTVGAGNWESVFATATVEVTAGAIANVEIEIGDAGADGLVVRLVGPGGTAVTGADLHVFAAVDPWEATKVPTVRPRKDGAWVVVPRKDSPSGREWMLSIHSESYGDKLVALPASLAGEFRVDFAEPASLDVTVTGYAGSGLEGRLRVDARPMSAGKDVQARYHYGSDDSIGPEGRRTIKPLQPGRYRVQLSFRRERWQAAPLERVEVDVAPGANAVSIPAPVVHTLVVILEGSPESTHVGLARVGATQSDEWHHSSRSGADGTATFEGLTAGSYRITLYGPKSGRNQSMKVTVPTGGPVRFKEDAETALLVKVLDAEGYLASAGLQQGDVITGVDGASFDGQRSALQVLSGLMMARKEIKLSVRREGKAFEATVDAEEFGAATNRLRALEPQ
jgi:hypothetical protein